MYIVDNIVYVGEYQGIIKVCGIRPLDNHMLLLRFNTGEIKIFDFKSLLEKTVYEPLKDIDIFKSVYIDYGVPVWNEGDIDIAPEFLYENSATVKETVLLRFWRA